MSFNPMANKTPDERRNAAAKGVATRRRNREIRAAEEQAAALAMTGKLHSLIFDIAPSIEGIRDLSLEMPELSNRTLLTKDEILSAARPWTMQCGIYFLIKANKIVYVGQSTNVAVRIGTHASVCGGRKEFDSYAFLACKPEALDKIESLYIHLLRPELNGDAAPAMKAAPIRLCDLLGLGAA